MNIKNLLNKLFPANAQIKTSKITTGKFNESYYVSTEKEEYVLRIAPDKDTPVLFYEKDMMKREPGIHSIILEKTDIPIPIILEHDFSGQIIPRNWLLMKKLSGTALSNISIWGRDQEKLFYELGVSLKHLHNIHNEWFGYPEGSGTGPKEKNWYTAFKDMWRRLLDNILETKFYSEKETNWLLNLLEIHSNSFNHNPKPTLLHMDVWSQNILTDKKGKLMGIVDWDRGLWGDPEIEFSVLEYCGMNPPSFWQGYDKIPEITKDYKIRNIFYFLYEHQKYIFIRFLRNNLFDTAKRYALESLNIAKKLVEI